MGSRLDGMTLDFGSSDIYMGKMMRRISFGQIAVIVLGGVLLFGVVPYLVGKATAQYSMPSISLDSPVTFPVDI